MNSSQIFFLQTIHSTLHSSPQRWGKANRIQIPELQDRMLSFNCMKLCKPHIKIYCSKPLVFVCVYITAWSIQVWKLPTALSGMNVMRKSSQHSLPFLCPSTPSSVPLFSFNRVVIQGQHSVLTVTKLLSPHSNRKSTKCSISIEVYLVSILSASP